VSPSTPLLSCKEVAQDSSLSRPEGRGTWSRPTYGELAFVFSGGGGSTLSGGDSVPLSKRKTKRILGFVRFRPPDIPSPGPGTATGLPFRCKNPASDKLQHLDHFNR